MKRGCRGIQEGKEGIVRMKKEGRQRKRSKKSKELREGRVAKRRKWKTKEKQKLARSCEYF